MEQEKQPLRSRAMPAQSKRSKAAKAKRQSGAETFKTVTCPDTESESSWDPTDSEGHGEESEEADAHGIMQLRFAEHFSKTLHKRDLAREPVVSFKHSKSTQSLQ